MQPVKDKSDGEDKGQKTASNRKHISEVSLSFYCGKFITPKTYLKVKHRFVTRIRSYCSNTS